MKVFLFWKKCDWCGTMQFLGLWWLKKEDKDYCCQACMEHRASVVRGIDEISK